MLFLSLRSSDQGHVKSICLNFGIARTPSRCGFWNTRINGAELEVQCKAKKFGGNCNLRFDDTNPESEKQAHGFKSFYTSFCRIIFHLVGSQIEATAPTIINDSGWRSSLIALKKTSGWSLPFLSVVQSVSYLGRWLGFEWDGADSWLRYMNWDMSETHVEHVRSSSWRKDMHLTISGSFTSGQRRLIFQNLCLILE